MSSIDVVNTATLTSPAGATSYSVPSPASTQAGDLIVVIAMNRSNPVALPPIADGWSYTTRYTAASSSVTGYYKALLSPAPVNWTFTASSASTQAGFAVYALRMNGFSGTWKLTWTGVNSDTTYPMTSPAVSILNAGLAIVSAGGQGNAGSNFTSPASPFVEVFNVASPGTATQCGVSGYQSFTDGGTYGPWDFGGAGSSSSALMSLGVTAGNSQRWNNSGVKPAPFKPGLVR